ncbi:MAG: hypothetical protein ACPG8V_01750 [Alphaproteobacteria bacterium]
MNFNKLNILTYNKNKKQDDTTDVAGSGRSPVIFCPGLPKPHMDRCGKPHGNSHGNGYCNECHNKGVDKGIIVPIKP